VFYKERGGNAKVYKFIHKEEVRGTQTRGFNYALSDEDGSVITIPEKEFLDGYESALPFKNVTAGDAIKETLVSIRAHSTIRFVALPFFLGAFALLANGFYASDSLPRLIIVIAAVGLSLFAIVFETVLSRNLVVWYAAIGAELKGTNSPWWMVGAHRNKRSLRAVRWVLFLPYPSALAFWVYQLLANWSDFGPCVSNYCAKDAAPALSLLIVAVVLTLSCILANAQWATATPEREWYNS